MARSTGEYVVKNKIEDLRNHLFEALEGLADKEHPMDIERAKAIADVARVVVDSAKAEVAFINATGERRGTGFIPIAAPEGASRPQLAAVNGDRR
jgi:hypothetical protein